MKRSPTQFLNDILRGIEQINVFVGTMTYDEFVNDLKTGRAVTQTLEIIGEAAKNLPAKLRNHYPTVPWADMSGLRDKIAHFYFGIDYKIVWNVVKEKLPEIKPLIDNIIKELKGGQLFE